MMIHGFTWILILLMGLYANRAICFREVRKDEDDGTPRFRILRFKSHLHYIYHKGYHRKLDNFTQPSEIKFEFFASIQRGEQYSGQGTGETLDKPTVSDIFAYKRVENLSDLIENFNSLILDGVINTYNSWGLLSVRLSAHTGKADNNTEADFSTFTKIQVDTVPIIMEHVVLYDKRPHNRNYKIRIGVSYSISCDKHVYGRMCDKYCNPANSVEGQQFTCDSEGGKHCLPGWYDENSNCTKQVSELACDGNPCLNGGTCNRMVGKNKIWCKCPSDFAGFLCEECKNDHFCHNGGTCIASNGTKTCKCLINFVGTQCEFYAKHPCTEQVNHCKNGGTCHDISDSASLCECPQGYSGSTCDEKINYCSEKFGDKVENPCANYGICISLSNTFTCICYPGTSGKYCELDIDECEISTCKDNERCVNTIGSYVCVKIDITDGQSRTQIGDTEKQKLMKEIIVKITSNILRNVTKETITKMMSQMMTKMKRVKMKKIMRKMMRKMMRKKMRKMMRKKMRKKLPKLRTEKDDKLENRKWDESKGKNICTTVKCLNGGTCIDRGDTYKCRCAEGFRGKTCKKTQ